MHPRSDAGWAGGGAGPRALTNLAWIEFVQRDLAIEFFSERDLTAMELYQRAIQVSV